MASESGSARPYDASVIITCIASTRTASIPARMNAAVMTGAESRSPSDATASSERSVTCPSTESASARWASSSNSTLSSAAISRAAASSPSNSATRDMCRLRSASTDAIAATRWSDADCSAAASSAFVVPARAETTTTGCRATRPRTISAVRRIAAASATEVPPNLQTIMRTSSQPRAARNHAGLHEHFSVEDRTPCGSPNRVVSHGNHAKVQDRILTDAPDRNGHPAAVAHVAPRLWPVRLVAIAERNVGRGGQPAHFGRTAPLANGRDRLFHTGSLFERHRQAHRVSILHRHAIRVRAHDERRRLDGRSYEASEHLLHLALDLRLFIADIGDDVAEDVERGNAGIARAGDRLHRGDEHRLQSEPLVQRRHRHRGDGGGAIRVRDDRAGPSARCALSGDEI